MPDTGEVKNKQRVNRLRKEPEMAYKKPEIVAKSNAKFVAGTPTFSSGCPRNGIGGCGWVNRVCMVTVAK